MAERDPRFAPLVEPRAVAPGGWAAALEGVARGAAPVLLHSPEARFAADAPGFAAAALALAEDPAVAGASLSLPRWRPGAARLPFVPLPDGGDGVYLGAVALGALVVTPGQAARLAGAVQGGRLVPPAGAILAPRSPLAWGAPGDQQLLMVGKRAWRLRAPPATLACYDARLELTPAAARQLAPMLADYAFGVDLWGNGGVEAPFLLSARPCSRPLLSYALELMPIEANLAHPAAGGFFAFGRAEDFAPMPRARHEALFRHATRYNALDQYAAQFLGPLRRLVGAKG